MVCCLWLPTFVHKSVNAFLFHPVYLIRHLDHGVRLRLISFMDYSKTASRIVDTKTDYAMLNASTSSLIGRESKKKNPSSLEIWMERLPSLCAHTLTVVNMFLCLRKLCIWMLTTELVLMWSWSNRSSGSEWFGWVCVPFTQTFHSFLWHLHSFLP